MIRRREDHRALIEALGSQTLRRRFRISSACLHNWRRRGIPINYRPAVAGLAQIWEVNLPGGFLDPLPGLERPWLARDGPGEKTAT